MADKFLNHINKIMDDPMLASVPKFPNNEKVKTVNKTHKESIDEISGAKVPDFKYYMAMLKKKAECLKDNTYNFQNRFNSLKSMADEIAEARELIVKKEQSLKESNSINGKMKEKHDKETRRVQEYYKGRQVQYNQYFDQRKAELE